MPQKPLRFYFLLAWVSIMPIIGSLIISSLLYLNPEIINSNSYHDLFLYTAIATILMSLALCPTTFISIISGFLIGWISVPLVISSYLIASTLGYLIFSRIDNDSLLNHIQTKPKLNEFFNRLVHRQFKLVVFSRLSPILPFAIMNVTLSALNVSFRNYITGSFIGMMPRTILSIYIGIESKDITQSIKGGDWDISKIVILVSLLLISSWGLKTVVKKVK